MSDKIMTTQNPQGMDVKRKDIPVMVHNQLDKLVAEGSLSFPAGYNASNAIQNAWMIIQDTKDRDNRPALDVCTVGSVMKTMLDTVIMGLNPAKKQVYYIVYGNKLEAQRSYFGTMAATKRVTGVKDIWADVVFEGDTFKIGKKRGGWEILTHESDFMNIDPEKIVAAYCTIEMEDGRTYTEVMNMAQIQKSWSKSRSSKQTVHKEFPDQMAKRTVINRACKMFFNTSDDSDLLIDSFNATGDVYDNEENIPDVVEKPADSRLQALNDIAAKATLPEPKNTVQEPAEEGMSLESIINEGEKEENEQLYLDR